MNINKKILDVVIELENVHPMLYKYWYIEVEKTKDIECLNNESCILCTNDNDDDIPIFLDGEELVIRYGVSFNISSDKKPTERYLIFKNDYIVLKAKNKLYGYIFNERSLNVEMWYRKYLKENNK